FSHAGSDPRVFCEPWVSAPVCHHRNSANPFAIKPMTGARNSTRLNYVPMGLVGRARAAGISNFASRAEPPADDAPSKWSRVLARAQTRGRLRSLSRLVRAAPTRILWSRTRG